MAIASHCPQCGGPLVPGALGNRCPRCLMGMGLSDADEADRLTPVAAIKQFGDYELLEEVGRGGMGVVYRARQISLNRIVAVKMLLARPFAVPELEERLHLEAEAAAGLNHPHIVTIYDFGECDDQFYFSMEYIEGRSLAQLTRHHSLAPKQAAQYLKTAAEAVHHAHEHGILHRDLKPSNILTDLHDQVKITDFGLAKRLGTDSELTLTGALVGSPNYLSPEQAAGQHRALTVRSDVYSLGAVLYQLLTARPPLVGDSLQETLVQIREKEVPLLRLLHPQIPRDLETICLKCLRKEPERRYASARELAEDLGRFLNGKPIRARPVSAAGRVWRWYQRNPAVALLSAAVLLALVGGVVVSALFALAQARARAEAERQLRLVTAVSDFLRYDLLLSADPMETGTTPSIHTLLENASAKLKGRFPDEPAVEGTIRQTLGFVYYRGLGKLELAEQELKQALILLQEQLGTNHPEALKTERFLATVYWEAGQYRKSEEIACQTFQRMDRVLGPEHEDTLWCLNTWGLALWELGRYREAEEKFQRILGRTQAVRGPTSFVALMAKGNLAHVYRDEGQWAEAEALYLEKLKTLEPLRGAENPFTLNTLQALADLYRKQGRYEEAKELLIRVRDYSVGVFPPEHRWRLSYQRSLGGVYRELGEYAAAQDLLLPTWETSRRVLGNAHPLTLEVQLELALLYHDLGRYREAEPLLIQVVEVWRGILGDEHPRTIASLEDLIALYEAWGRPEEAEKWRKELERVISLGAVH